jgi:hypothetical protein
MRQPAIPARHRSALKGLKMAKGNNSQRGNKEAKKPKQEKPKVSATATTVAGKPPITIAGKKMK